MTRLFVCLIIFIGMTPAAWAQNLPAEARATLGLSEQQFDTLVRGIANAVADRLEADGRIGPPVQAANEPSAETGKAPPAPKIVHTAPANGPRPIALLVERLGIAFAALPNLMATLGDLPNVLDNSSQSGRSAGTFALLVTALVAFALAAEWAVRRALRPYLVRLAERADPRGGVKSLGPLGAIALLQAMAVGAAWLICDGASSHWFAGMTPQDRFGAAILASLVNWRIIAVMATWLLQPALPAARLCDVGDTEARALQLNLSALVAVIIALRTLGSFLMSGTLAPATLAMFQVIVALAALTALLLFAFRSREAARQWFGGLSKVAPLAGVVGRHWNVVAPIFFIILSGSFIQAAVFGRPVVAAAMLLTLGLVSGLMIFETLMQALVRRFDSQLEGLTPASNRVLLPDVIARCVRVAALLAVTVALAETWAVNVLALVDASDWIQLTSSSRTAGVTLFVAFVLWELFKYLTEPYMARKGAEDALGESDEQGAPASRLSTMMPLLRRTAATLITLVAVMVALESFGVNITPLIAGASVFGIAISFGSQTLVKDIVSGIFYLSDDAFRVGEYIDCGKAKGTVEGFTLRSIKLRHQNGQVHTIPFGQLGQITNFSRDWLTVKFNLRFARDTDIEKLRKAAKKIGADMLEVPSIKNDIIAPFKMQGIADITGNALVARFKFTARPNNPAAIQREAVKRMITTLPTLGIEFAADSAAVVVHSAAPAPASVPEGSHAQFAGPVGVGR